jgi:hypothetical protein
MSPLPAPTDKMAVMPSSTILNISTSTQSPCRPGGSLITDPSTPPSSIPASLPLPSNLVLETPQPQPSQQQPGMSFGTKLGLGMIPVILSVCALWIIFLFWWRRRQKTRQSVEAGITPRVPEKDFLSLVPSLECSRRGSKVFNMAAFSTPIYNAGGKRREALVYNEYEQQQQQQQEQQREDTEKEKEKEKEATTEHASGHKQNDSYSDIVRLAALRTGSDSPIDRTCPFRLKRGNTVRGSIGSAVSGLWPAVPEEVWVKRSERPRSPGFGRRSW